MAEQGREQPVGQLQGFRSSLWGLPLPTPNLVCLSLEAGTVSPVDTRAQVEETMKCPIHDRRSTTIAISVPIPTELTVNTVERKSTVLSEAGGRPKAPTATSIT